MRRFVVADTSMQPSIRPGDRLIVACWLTPREGDIVVFRDPEAHNTFMVKRVHQISANNFDLRGDNPYVSRDSRHFGPVPKAWIVGRVVYRYLPAARRGSL